MKVTYKITNEEKFNELGINVETSGLKFRGTNERGKSLGFKGSISIETNEGSNTITGEFGENDYVEIYGFVFTIKNYIICDRTTNSGKEYITDDGSNTAIMDNAEKYESKNDAQKRIDGNGWNDWASIEEIEI